jgi:hypothetical protein
LKTFAFAAGVVFTFAACSGPGNGGTGGGGTGGGGTGGGTGSTGGGTAANGGGTSAMGGGTAATGGGTSAMGGGTGTGGGSAARVPLHGYVVEGGMNGQTTPIANATVFLADDPTTTTATDADGGFTLMVPALTDNFVHAQAINYKDSEQGVYLQTDGGGGDNFYLGMITFAEFLAVRTVLGPPLTTVNSSKGLLVIEFKDQGTKIPGAFGADISQRYLTSFTFSPDGGPYYSDAGSDGSPLIFADVDSGTTTITLHPPAGITCVLDPPFTNWRIDPATFTHTTARCQ